MLYKCVNGVSVPMSAEEENAIRSEWEARAAAPPEPPADPVKKLADFLKANPDVAKIVCQ